MLIEFQARRRRRMSMTSLIDVIFLLLLFFMLSSTFTRFAEIDVASPAKSGAAGGTTADVLVKLTANGWMINGQVYPEAAIVAPLTAFREKGAERVLVLLAPEASSQMLITALETLKRLNFSVSVSE